MADLSIFEQMKFETLFGMESGYVLDFSNRSFQAFIATCTGIDVYDEKYNYYSGSKANRLRAFWKEGSNYIVGKLLLDLLEYWKTKKLTSYSGIESAEQALFDECYAIADRLYQDTKLENVDVIQPYSEERDFALLAKSIRESIQKNEPETALDRLHTFVVKYVRRLCDKHGISYDKDKPLQSIFGEYVKFIKQNGIINSAMTERILKSSISVLDAFNDVRNNHSFAHDNPILNYDESMLIFGNIANLIEFIESIEGKETQEAELEEESNEDWGEIPF